MDRSSFPRAPILVELLALVAASLPFVTGAREGIETVVQRTFDIVPEGVLPEEFHRPTFFRMSTDERLVLVGRPSEVHIYDVRTRCLVERIEHPAGTVTGGAAFDPSGRFLLYSTGTAPFYDTASRARIASAEGRAPFSLSEDGSVLAYSRPAAIHCRFLASGAEVRIPRPSDPVDTPASALSPDGSLLAAASFSAGEDPGSIYDTATGRSLLRFPRMHMPLRFDSKGERVAYSEYGGRWEATVAVVDIPARTVIRTSESVFIASVLAALGAPEEMVQAAGQARSRRLRRLGLTDEDIRFGADLPGIAIRNRDSIPLAIDSSATVLRVEASGRGHPLDRLLLYVNGVPVFGRSGMSLSDENATGVRTDLPVRLATGLNKVQVSVVDSRGAESIRETIFVNRVSELREPGKIRILSIGVSDVSREVPLLTSSRQRPTGRQLNRDLGMVVSGAPAGAP